MLELREGEQARRVPEHRLHAVLGNHVKALAEISQRHVDLASERFGAAVIAANDEFFAPKGNLIKAGPAQWIEGKYTDRGKWMDGWETRRRRDEGTHDWCVIRLGARGHVRGVDVETTHFKGNYPESCAFDA